MIKNKTTYFIPVIIISLMLISSKVIAQAISTDKNYSSRKLLGLGKNAEQLGDYYSAIEYFTKYLEQKPSNSYVREHLANNYRYARDYVAAELHYKYLIDSSRKVSNEVYYHYADMILQQGRYEDALEAFNVSRKNRPSGSLRYFVRRRIEGCETALAYNDSLKRTMVVHLNKSINNWNTELSPLFLNNNTLLYSSLKTKAIDYYDIDKLDVSFPVTRFYVANRVSDTIFENAAPWKFNNEKYNVGNGIFSFDGNRFYFTQCSRNWRNKVICNAYVSKNIDGEWTEPHRIASDMNQQEYTTTQLAIGRESKYNREVIYFVSDRPGGKGGMDIWYSTYYHENDKYGKSRNVGSRINSRGDELTPFYDRKTGRLYFSSNYFPGFGGQDIFYCNGELRKWTKPENIGGSLNSPADDLYFNINPHNSREGFLVSNRVGSNTLMHATCCDDIYYYKSEEIDRLFLTGLVKTEELDEIQSASLKEDIITYLIEGSKRKNVIIDSSMLQRIDKFDLQKIGNEANLMEGAIVSIYLITTNEDNEEEEEIYIYSDTTNNNGRYFLELEPYKEYKITYKKDEFFNENVNLSTKIIGWSDTIYLDAIGLKPIPTKPVQFNVYYDFDSSRLKEKSKVKIDTTLLTLLKESPDLIVEISSHTDSMGTIKYNQRLSQDRAQSVVNYLIENGIDISRLIAVGYGEESPIASNSTDEGRALNRRTEFRVVGSLDQFSKVNVGEFTITKKNPKARKDEFEDEYEDE